MMSRLLTIPRFWGPVFTIIFTGIYDRLAAWFGFTPSPALLFCFLALGCFLGGLRAGLLCALWISVYAVYAVDDTSRVIQVILSAFLIAGIIGWQTRELRKFYKAADELLNGNAEKLREGLSFLREARVLLSKARKKIELSEDRLGNVLSGVVGYGALRKAIKEVEAWYSDPENVEKARRMDEVKALGESAPIMIDKGEIK